MVMLSITLKQLKYALAVAEQLHFAKAAHACSISQSALSTAISDLETQLGFVIFERNNKQVLITPLGKEVLERARVINTDVKDIAALKLRSSGNLQGAISIGMIPTIAPFLLPQILPKITKTHPHLDLSIEEDTSAKLVSKVLTGDLDTAILALPYDCSGLLSLPFWQERFLYAIHQDMAPNDSKKIDIKNINLEKLMLLQEGHCLKDHALQVCGLGNDLQLNMRGSSLHTLVELVAGKLGTTLIPELALPSFERQYPEIRTFELQESGVHRELAFVARPNYPGFDNVNQLKELIIKQLQMI